MKRKLLAAALLLTFFSAVSAQEAAPEAIAMLKQAVKLEDEGKIDDALPILKEGEKKYPDVLDFPYERAYCYYYLKQYDEASKILEKLADHPNTFARVFQLLGNAYDLSGKTDKALKTYEKGLKQFSAAGELYLETGNIWLVKKDYNKAVFYYEEGIKADPAYSSNYYRAARLYCNSAERVWGMLYGEMFMNLEPNSKRTVEISKLLFNTYAEGIQITSDTSMAISFSKMNTVTVTPDGKMGKMPFGVSVYEPLLLMAFVLEKKVDIESLNRARTGFLKSYYDKKFNETYPNVLLERQAEMEKAGHLEAYNHWILMQGDAAGFEKWQSANEDKWKAFATWFSANRWKLDAEHRFYRSQY
jgi:tetratricopeptide (TPR) repeat protein